MLHESKIFLITHTYSWRAVGNDLRIKDSMIG